MWYLYGMFFFRQNLLNVVETYQYPDYEDYFERPPYSVLLHSPTTGKNIPVLIRH